MGREIRNLQNWPSGVVTELEPRYGEQRFNGEGLRPPGDTGPCLETVLVVITGEWLLVSSGQRPGMLLIP